MKTKRELIFNPIKFKSKKTGKLFGPDFIMVKDIVNQLNSWSEQDEELRKFVIHFTEDLHGRRIITRYKKLVDYAEIRYIDDKSQAFEALLESKLVDRSYLTVLDAYNRSKNYLILIDVEKFKIMISTAYLEYFNSYLRAKTTKSTIVEVEGYVKFINPREYQEEKKENPRLLNIKTSPIIEYKPEVIKKQFRNMAKNKVRYDQNAALNLGKFNFELLNSNYLKMGKLENTGELVLWAGTKSDFHREIHQGRYSFSPNHDRLQEFLGMNIKKGRYYPIRYDEELQALIINFKEEE